MRARLVLVFRSPSAFALSVLHVSVVLPIVGNADDRDVFGVSDLGHSCGVRFGRRTSSFGNFGKFCVWNGSTATMVLSDSIIPCFAFLSIRGRFLRVIIFVLA